MANTYVYIASGTVGSGDAASIEFTGIPQTYTDLLLSMSLRGNQNQIYHAATIRFNGGTANYSSTEIQSDGTSATSANRSSVGSAMYGLNAAGTAATANTFSNGQIYIPNYAGAANKSVSIDHVSENNATESYIGALAGLGTATAGSAITSISLIPLASHGTAWKQHSTAYLYGISNS